MVEKMVDMFTPEMIAIVIVCLTALTLFTSLMVLMTLASLSRVKKRLLVITGKCLELEEEHATLQQIRQTMSNNIAHLVDVDTKIESIESRLNSLDSQLVGVADVADKLTSIEHRLDGLDQKFAQSQNLLTGHEFKLNEHDTIIGQTGQLMGKNAAGFSQAVQRFHTLEQEFQGLKAFQRSFEQTRNRILNALGAAPVEMPPQNIPSTEQRGFKEEAVVPPESKKLDVEDLYKSRMPYGYP